MRRPFLTSGISLRHSSRPVNKILKIKFFFQKRNSIKLLNVMAEMPKREGPDVFFAFPGKASAVSF